MLGPLPSLAPLAGRGGIETAPPSLEKVLLERKKVNFVLPGLGDGWGHGSR